MPLAVVDVLEAIEVDHDEGLRLDRAPRSRVDQKVGIQGDPVGQVRERVPLGLALLLADDPVDGHGHEDQQRCHHEPRLDHAMDRVLDEPEHQHGQRRGERVDVREPTMPPVRGVDDDEARRRIPEQQAVDGAADRGEEHDRREAQEQHGLQEPVTGVRTYWACEACIGGVS